MPKRRVPIPIPKTPGLYVMFEKIREAVIRGARAKRNPERQPWFGKVYELGEKIRAEYREGKIPVASQDAAYAWAVHHYEQPNGQSFTARSLAQSVRQHEDLTEGRKR